LSVQVAVAVDLETMLVQMVGRPISSTTPQLWLRVARVARRQVVLVEQAVPRPPASVTSKPLVEMDTNQRPRRFYLEVVEVAPPESTPPETRHWLAIAQQSKRVQLQLPMVVQAALVVMTTRLDLHLRPGLVAVVAAPVIEATTNALAELATMARLSLPGLTRRR
jgi:hypothetical protein